MNISLRIAISLGFLFEQLLYILDVLHTYNIVKAQVRLKVTTSFHMLQYLGTLIIRINFSIGENGPKVALNIYSVLKSAGLKLLGH